MDEIKYLKSLHNRAYSSINHNRTDISACVMSSIIQQETESSSRTLLWFSSACLLASALTLSIGLNLLSRISEDFYLNAEAILYSFV